MKRLGKVFLGMLCIILLFAYSHASDKLTKITPNKDKGVTFKWEPVKKRISGKDIVNVDKIRYKVYVYQAENINEKPPEEKDFERLKTEKRLEVKSPIKEISCKIKFDKPGYYFLGVQTKLKDEVSVVSWSCSETCATNPQYVYVPK
jgi:hypothetical protein